MPGINDVEIVLHLHENWENLTQTNKVDLLRKLRLISNIRHQICICWIHMANFESMTVQSKVCTNFLLQDVHSFFLLL